MAGGELTTALIIVYAGRRPTDRPQRDEGLGSYIRAKLYMSFMVFSVCLMLIILGVNDPLPCYLALVIWVAYKAAVRFTGSLHNLQLASARQPTRPVPTSAGMIVSFEEEAAAEAKR